MFEFLRRMFAGRPAPEQVYLGLRDQLLQFPLLTPSDAIAVMDWHVSKAVATVVAVSDGTVSLYFSSGGGTIGAGGHPGPRAAAGRMLVAARAASNELTAATRMVLPGPGQTALHLRTAEGLRSAVVSVRDLQIGQTLLAGFFGAGQDVITALRTLK